MYTPNAVFDFCLYFLSQKASPRSLKAKAFINFHGETKTQLPSLLTYKTASSIWQRVGIQQLVYSFIPPPFLLSHQRFPVLALAETSKTRIKRLDTYSLGWLMINIFWFKCQPPRSLSNGSEFAVRWQKRKFRISRNTDAFVAFSLKPQWLPTQIQTRRNNKIQPRLGMINSPPTIVNLMPFSILTESPPQCTHAGQKDSSWLAGNVLGAHDTDPFTVT